jgi:hypothetical protein
MGDLEQYPTDMCRTADHDVLASIFAQRPTLLIYNRHDDCCFQTKRARQSIERPARKVFKLLDAGDSLEFHDNVDPGTHAYEADNRSQLYRFLNKHFGLDTPELDLPYRDKLLTETERNVGLPADNATLHSMALDRLQQFRRKRERRQPQAVGVARKGLLELLALPTYSKVIATPKGATLRRQRMTCRHEALSVGPWLVPATTITPEGGARSGTEIVIGDGGRRAAAGLAGVAAGRRAIAVDLFGTGEARTANYQEAMLLACAVERPLGILVAQLLAVATWSSKRYKTRAVHLRASGETMAVVAPWLPR